MAKSKKKVPFNRYGIAEFKNEYNDFIYPSFKKTGHEYGYPLSLAIISEINKLHVAEFQLDVKDLKDVLHFDYSKSRISFKRMLQRADADMNAVITHDYGKSKGFVNYHVVQSLEYDPINKKVNVKVNPEIIKYFDIVHDEGGYTKTLVDEIATLNSFYSRQIYMILRQWRTIGKTAPIRLDELKSRLQIPKSYRINQIRSRVIQASITEIEKLNYFKNITVHDVTDPTKFHLPDEKKNGRKRILGFYFTFTKQNPTFSEMKKGHKELQNEQVLVKEVNEDKRKAENNPVKFKKSQSSKPIDNTADFNNFM